MRASGNSRRDAADRFHSTHLRHPEIHQDHVGLVLPVQSDGELAVLRLGHELEIGLLGDDGGQPGPDDRVIVRDQDTAPRGGRVGALVSAISPSPASMLLRNRALRDRDNSPFGEGACSEPAASSLLSWAGRHPNRLQSLEWKTQAKRRTGYAAHQAACLDAAELAFLTQAHRRRCPDDAGQARKLWLAVTQAVLGGAAVIRADLRLRAPRTSTSRRPRWWT